MASACYYSQVKAQLIVDNAAPYDSVNWLVQNVLVANGMTVSNVLYNGSPVKLTGAAANTIGYFDGSNSNIGLSYGVLLNTGNISDAPGPNDSQADGFDNGLAGDSDLTQMAGVPTYNAAILEFDFVTSGTEAYFTYVFASEEYNETVCGPYNDGFGLFVSGPGITGPFSNGAKNIALIPNTSTYVTINNVNNGNIGFAGTPGGCGGSGDPGLNNSIYFTDNEALGGQSVQYDGFTVPLISGTTVVPGQTYHLKIAVADATDGSYDSGIFLEGGSFGGPLVMPFSLAGILVQPDSCGGVPNGSIDIHVLGGEEPYTYSWSNGDTTQNISNLDSGTYILTITDNMGEVLQDTFYVGWAVFPLIFGGTPSNCDSATGSIWVLTPGGAFPFTYQWNDSSVQTTATATGLGVGVYSITVTDGFGCVVQGTSQIFGNSLQISASGTNVTCPADSNGVADVLINSGIPPYTYLWNDSLAQTTASATGLSAGTYVVQVWDSVFCLGTTSALVTGPQYFVVISSQNNISCNGGSDGWMELMPYGGTPPYSFDWLQCNGPSSGTSIFVGISAGQCCVEVIDSNGCIANSCVTFVDPLPLLITTTSIPSQANDSTGSIDLTLANAYYPPWQFSWSNGDSTEDLNGVMAGMYYVTVTDAKGCMAIDSAEVEVSSGVQPNGFNSSFFVFPNPNSGQFTVNISVSTAMFAQVRIFNMLGEQVYIDDNLALFSGTNKITINVKDLNKGIYLLDLRIGVWRETERIVIN